MKIRKARSQSPVRISREVLLAGAKTRKVMNNRSEAILTLMHKLNNVIESSVMIKHSLAHSQAGLDKFLAVVGLYESIIDDETTEFFTMTLMLLSFLYLLFFKKIVV